MCINISFVCHVQMSKYMYKKPRHLFIPKLYFGFKPYIFHIYIYIYKRTKEDIIFQPTRMFELLVLLFTIQLLAWSNIFIPNIDKGDSQFQLNTIEKTTESLHVPFLKNLKKNYKKEKKIKKPFGNRWESHSQKSCKR